MQLTQEKDDVKRKEFPMQRPAYIHERGSVAPYVLVPGSGRRVEQFAATWDTSRKLAEHYEFLVYSGEMSGVPVTACSTGCGGRSTSIAVDEMAALGGTTFIRVGVTGSLQDHVAAGDLIIASGAVRLDRTSEHYVRIEYPAAADFEVTSALIAAAQKFGFPFHVGIGATPASFSAGEGFATFGGYRQAHWENIAPDLKAVDPAAPIELMHSYDRARSMIDTRFLPTR